MKLTLVAGPEQCDDDECPAVYATDRSTVVVQGARVSSGDAPGGVPDHEAVVEIPADLLRRAAAKLA